MWPGPVTTVEVLTQPAAIRGPQGPTSTRTPAQFGDHIIMFLKLSAKLYTSVFHHGLKVLSLKSSARHELGRQECRRGNEPLGLRTEGPSQGWCPLPPSRLPAHTPALAGTSGQAAIMFILWTEGAGTGTLTARTRQSPLCLFYLFKIVCVNQAWWPVPVIPSLRRLRQARSCLRKKKKNDFHKAGLFLQISLSVPAPGLSWPPSHVPSSVDILAVFERELSYGGH